MLNNIDRYIQANAYVNKFLNPDGSETTLDGSIVFSPPDPERAKIYASSSAYVNKVINADGTESELAVGGGGGTVGKTYSLEEKTVGNVTLLENGVAVATVKLDDDYVSIVVFDNFKVTVEKNHSKDIVSGTITLTDGLDNSDNIYSKTKIDNINSAINTKNTEQDERITALENNPSTGLPNYAGVYLDGIVRVPPLLSATPIGAKFVDDDNDYYTSTTNVSDVSDFIFKETGIYKIDVTVDGSATNNNANLTAVYWKNGVPIIGQNYNTNTGNFNVTYQFIINVTNTADIYQFGAFDDGAGTITLNSFFSLTAKQSEALKQYVTLPQFNASQGVQNTRISANENNISNNVVDIANNTAKITLNSTNIALLDGRVGTNETNVADLQSRLTLEEAKSSDVQSSDDITFTFFDKNGNAKKSWTIVDTSIFHYIGEFGTVAELPTTGNAGDIAKVTDDSKYYLFDGTSWNIIEINLDLSNYYTKAEIDNFNTNFQNVLDSQQTVLTKVVADVLVLDGAIVLINQKLANLEQNLTIAIGNIAVLDYAIVQLNNKVDNQIVRIDSNENNIVSLQNKDVDLQGQIDNINASRVFNYVVPTFADLPATAVDDELALVLSDTNYSDLPTYYKWVTTQWVYQANYNKDYYTKAESDSLLNSKANVSDLQSYQKPKLTGDDGNEIATLESGVDIADLGTGLYLIPTAVMVELYPSYTGGELTFWKTDRTGVAQELDTGAIYTYGNGAWSNLAETLSVPIVIPLHDINSSETIRVDDVVEGDKGTINLNVLQPTNPNWTNSGSVIKPNDGIAIVYSYSLTVYTGGIDSGDFVFAANYDNSTYNYDSKEYITASSTFNIQGTGAFNKTPLFQGFAPVLKYKNIVGTGDIQVRINTMFVEIKKI